MKDRINKEFLGILRLKKEYFSNIRPLRCRYSGAYYDA